MNEPVSDQRGGDLPRTLAIAWGRAEPATRGPRAGLTVEAIVEAAIALADAEGLGAVSMARVAERLGYTPMSLYRHVPSKDDLLSLVQDAAFEGPPDIAPGSGWREGLATWARTLRASYAARPWVLDLPITGPPAMPRQLAWLDRALAALEGTTLSVVERLSATLVLSGYSRSSAQLWRDVERGRRRRGLTTEQSDSEYWRLLAELVTEDRFPALHAAIRGGLVDEVDRPEGGDGAGEEGGDLDDEFEFGLQRILDGLEAYMTVPRPG